MNDEAMDRAARAVWPFLGRVARDAATAIGTVVRRELEPIQRARRAFELAVEAAAIRFAAAPAKAAQPAGGAEPGAARVLLLGRVGTGDSAADARAEAHVKRLREAFAPRAIVVTVLVEEAHHEAAAFRGARFVAVADAGVRVLWEALGSHDAVIVCDAGGPADIVGVRTIGALGLAAAAGRPAFAIDARPPLEPAPWLARMGAKATFFGADAAATAAWAALGLAAEAGEDPARVATRIAEVLR